MKQMTLSTSGFDQYAKITRQAVFLAEMERVLPRVELGALVNLFKVRRTLLLRLQRYA